MDSQQTCLSALLVLAVIVGSGAATVASAGGTASSVPEPRVQPQVSNGSATNVTPGLEFTSQTSYGGSVVLDEANLSDGGFVAIRNETRGTDPLVGVSRYLAPGNYEDLRVRLFAIPGRNASELRLQNDSQLTAVLHRDTDGDRRFEFANDRRVDGPVRFNGTTIQNPANVSVTGTAALVRTQPTAEVSFVPQSSGTGTVTVRSTTLSAGGFVAVHRGEGTSGPIVGVSRRLDRGAHQDVRVQLFDVPGRNFTRTSLGRTQNLTAVPYLDTNNNSRFDYVMTNESADFPYLHDGSPVTNPTTVRVNATGPAGGTAGALEAP